MYIYIYIMFRVNEKSMYHRYATLSFLPLHSSGILVHYLLQISFRTKWTK